MKLQPIGVIRSELVALDEAPKQGSEGAPDAWLEVDAQVADGLLGVAVGDELIVITWLHQADWGVLRVHPRSDPSNPLTGVFATRSPDRRTRWASTRSPCERSMQPPAHRPD